MKNSIKFTLAVLAFGSASTSWAQTTITAADTQNQNSFTTAGGEMTVSALFDGSTGATFANSSTFIGVQGGFKDNSFVIRDYGTSTQASEGMLIDLASDQGLSQMTFQYYAGDLQISGFTEDPLAVGSDSAGNGHLAPGDFSYDSGDLTVAMSGNPWGTVATIDFTNISASEGQSLTMSLVDGGTNTNNPQIVALSVTSDVAPVPEPATAAAFLGLVSLLPVFLRRRAHQ